MEHVILVDAADNEIGTMEKMEAHTAGRLHRAFSILLFNSNGEMLLQKRSGKKYHSAGLWTNTCCSHPLPGEDIEAAARRKLQQEMGIQAHLEFAYKFIYKTVLENNLTEHEVDHVFVGKFDGEPSINHEEVEEWRFESMKRIRLDIKKNSRKYTFWFKLIVNYPQLDLLVV